jgi:hypothetical protein
MIAFDENITSSSITLTLSQRLADGPIPLTKALHYALMLGEELRQIHDSGRTCGAVLPSNIAVTATGLELIDTPSQPGTVTPYTAPEILQGHPADSRSDIFAFGAIVYEMVTGLRAFAGDNADALAVSLAISTPPPCGIPAVDHLVNKCITRDPDVRCQRMQKVILELKILAFAPPRTDGVTLQQGVMAALRAETEQLEARMAALLQTHQKAIIDMQLASDDVIRELRGRLSNVESELAAAQGWRSVVEKSTEALSERIMAHVEQSEQNVEAIDLRVADLKDGIDVLGQNSTVLQEYVGARMHDIEENLKSQRAAIASVAAGQLQTDDVVEGVVAAMELLQSSVFDREEEYALG